jgi:hypothetical protein
MKKILIAMSLLGIILNPLSAGLLFSPTPETDDTYTLNASIPDQFGTPTPLDSLDAIQTYLNSVPGLGINSTNLGEVYEIDGYRVMELTTLETDPGLKTYILIEDNATSPSVFKLEAVEGEPYQGAPLVSDVHAGQEAGTKDVKIEFNVLLAEDANANGGDKASTIEFWFKSDPSSPQWERCLFFRVPDGTDSRQGMDGPIQVSGDFYAIWKAGDQKPNFKTETGKIRVLVAYDRDDGFGTVIQGSGWDGFEAENGQTFTTNPNMPALDYGSTPAVFDQVIEDNNIARIGSFNNEGLLIAVYQFTSDQLQILSGTSGIPEGKYAFGEIFNPNSGYPEPKLIPVQ